MTEWWKYKPGIESIQERIDAELLRYERDFTPQPFQTSLQAPPPSQAPIEPFPSPFQEAPVGQPTLQPLRAGPTQIQPLERPLEKPEEKPIEIPFWQRALQVFTAPFEWVDENVIKPGLSLAVTGVGFVPEVQRKAGEDFFEWKKRSWEEWKAPGVNVNIPWSNDPWRVDVKGVLEFAPWLLIPGAGQVGGAVRAARGIAGVAGQFGKTGKALGFAIEYSPWGLVEKTAGVALRGGIRAVGKATGGVSTRVGEHLFGKMPEPTPLSPTVKKFANYLNDVVLPARKAFEEALTPQLRAPQAGRLATIAKRHRAGEITSAQRLRLEEKALKAGGLKGQFAVEPFKFNKKKMNELLDPIYKAAENDFEAMGAAKSLRNLFLTGELPEPRFFRQYAKAYGLEFAKAIKGLTNLPSSRVNKILDFLNIPRSVLASADLSATFRQGLILALTHPVAVPRAFWRQLKGFASEKLALQADDALRARPMYEKATKELGVEFTAVHKGAELIAKEEFFTSNLAQSIPFVRRSERAFTIFLNEMKMASAESAYGAMKAQGASATQMKLMGKFIMIASGRGELPANLTQYAPVFSTVLFSPRLQAATLQLPRQIGRMLLSKNPYMRKEAAKALITFIGGGASLITLLNATGVTEKVELDPRSGDFGKIKVGETRLDIWRGYLQYIRFVAQLTTSERKSAYGNMNKVQRDEVAWRFLQSKSSPAFGLMVDLLKGENYMGEPLFEKTTGAIKTARNRFLPIAMQDIIDATEQSGMNGLWTAAPATLGIGTLTYVNDLVRVKEKIARDAGYDSWDDIDPKTQRQIQNRNAELQTAYIDFDRQVMGTAWGDWRNAGNAIDEVFRESVDRAVAQFQQTQDGYIFREKVGDAFTARRGGYDARNKETRFSEIVNRLKITDSAELLVKLGPQQTAIRIYNEALWGDDMYDEFGDYRFDEAEIRKQQLRQQMGDEMFSYVEEYSGLKYETFPDEYKELAQAKQVMRPYWQVRDEAIKLFGEPRTSSQERRLDSFISKIRRRLRRTNPEIAVAYNRFYRR